MATWSESIHRNAGHDAVHKIGFYPPVRYLHDLDFCSILSSDLAKNCSNWESRLATATLWEQLPDEQGLYMFVWKPQNVQLKTERNDLAFPWCLYVGKTEATLRTRYKNEYSKYLENPDPSQFWDISDSTSRAMRLKRLFALDKLEFWYCTANDVRLIANLEERLIKAFNPPGNIKNKLKPTAAPFPAFSRSY
jgi:hypothetical protein